MIDCNEPWCTRCRQRRVIDEQEEARKTGEELGQQMADQLAEAASPAMERLQALRAERDVLAAIVRDLAAVRAMADAGEEGVCPICLAEVALVAAQHEPSCAFRRAREWMTTQETK